ncbi:hypothetical protein HYPSUDRAFT_64108 [Hypholoma sublateritium FD-334 SS-4]|uniref:Protein kinase domain-containing protein n=1 Tax=Hypholoma sublateritium (strain FD-334 SS-4) TaxID=945553 RepID=A0A0D2P639_HYPSF|nr:hypothetical protein HYPSUDRAFT_64108 [Hypholoma sublateritium FD-334 SS-4]
MPAKQRKHSTSRTNAKKAGYDLALPTTAQISKIDTNTPSQHAPMRKDMNRDALPESSIAELFEHAGELDIHVGQYQQNTSQNSDNADSFEQASDGVFFARIESSKQTSNARAIIYRNLWNEEGVDLFAPKSRSSVQTVSKAQASPKKRKRDQEEEGHASPVKKLSTNGRSKPPVIISVSITNKKLSEDQEGHYNIVPGDILHRRYRTVKQLGKGTFSKVVEAIDTETNARVAIKIVRAIAKYRNASQTEIRILKKLREIDPANKNNCIHLLTWFEHQNHICLVSELLGMCLYDFMKGNNHLPFPRHHVQELARQLLGSVAFLHDIQLIHTDLKPENILLVRNDYKLMEYIPAGKRKVSPTSKRVLECTDIRLIDFGSATFMHGHHSAVITTRHYRAPEVILGLGWAYPCDAYSLGCILAEFVTGTLLYHTHDDLEQLAMMARTMNGLPARLAGAGARAKPAFFRLDGTLDWPTPTTSRQSRKNVAATPRIQSIVRSVDGIDRHFLDLMSRLLALDPVQRITVRNALAHPYFSLEVPPKV